MDVRSPLFQNIALIVAGVLFLNPIAATAAQLTVDQAAGGNTAVTQAGNGVPVVNIATPNGSGLSHNKFTDYNVGQQGLILNNATDKLQSTQLGGIILGNANLKNGAAGLILNEVTGGNTSQLRGYTEVAGKSAAVIVANPHGITCDGCGFINTPRVTLSTGTPVVDDGRLQRFDVDGGQIAIEGQGLNAGNVDQFDLITRSAQINAELHAKKLNIITGRNEVDAATLATTAKADDGSDKPMLAIDSSALGGMYAGAIRLVGTEQGVGVKLAGDMAASAGDIQIDANGQLSLARTAASRDLQLAASEIELGGDTYAGGKAELSAQSQLRVQQSLAAAGDVSLTGTQIVNSGVIEAGVSSDNSRTSADLKVNAQQVRNSGTLIGNRQLEVNAGQVLDNRGGTLSGKTLIQIDATQLDNRQGRLLADQQLQIRGENLNNDGGLLQSLGNAEIVSTGELLNRQGEILVQQDVLLAADALDNSQDGLIAGQVVDAQAVRLDNRAGLISARQGLRLNTGQIDNRGAGLINSAGRLDLIADRLDSSQGGEVSAKGDLHLQVGELIQQQGRLIGEAGLRLDLADGVLDNQGGLITARGALSLNDAGRLDNRGGEISSNAGIQLRGQHLDNRDGGRIIATERLDIAAQTVDNSRGGLISGWKELSLAGVSLDNSDQGTLSSREGALNVALSGALDNSGAGALVSQGPQHIGAASLDNRNQGILSSEAGIELVITGQLNNDSQGLISAQTLDIAANQTLNRGGQISSDGALLLNGVSLDNRGGALSAGQSLSATLSAALLNGGAGRLASGGPLLLKAASLDNQGGQLTSQSLLELFAASLDNSAGGTLAANGSLDLWIEGTLDNSVDGLIYSQQGDLHVSAGSLDNSAGTLQSQGMLEVVVDGALGNLGGRLSSQGGNVNIAAASLDNGAQGVLTSLVGWLKLNIAGLFDNRSGTAQAQTLEVAAGQVNNAAGHLSALAGDAQVTTGVFANQGGGLYATQRLDVVASRFDNQGTADGQGGKVAAETIDFSLSGALDNRHGLIESGTTLNIGAASLDNRNGALRALGQAGSTRIATSSGALDNRFGRIEIGNLDFALEIAGLQNVDGHILHVGNGTFGLSSANAVQAGGSLVSNGDFSLNAASWNHSGTLQARNLTLNVGTFNQTASGRLLATQSLSATGGTWINQGLIASDGSLALDLSDAYGGDGRLVSLGDLTLAAASIDLSDSASIAGGGLTHISATGLLSNRGTLTANDDLTLRADILNNHGTLGSAENLRLHAPTLRNENGLIFSGSDMVLRVDSFTNRFADVYSLGAIDLAKDDQGNTGALLENISATLESAGNLRLAVSQLINRKDVFAVENEQASGQISVRCYDCSGDHHNVDYIAREVFESRVVEDSPSALLQSGADLDIVVGSLENRYSTIAAAGDLRIVADSLDNLGAATGQSVRTRIWNTGRVTDGTDERFRYNYINPYNAQALPKEVPVGALSSFALVSDITEVTPTGVAAAAIIQAGGDVSVTVAGAVNNDVVLRQTVGTGSERGADTAVDGSTQPVVVTLNPQLPPDLAQQQVNPLELPGFSLPTGDNGLFRLSGQGSEQTSGSAGHDGSLPVQQLQHVQGLPATSRPAGAHKYLIETNPALTSLTSFLNSDYLLGNLGFEPDQAQKRLGDGLYEQRMIRESIVARTGQRYLAGLTSDEAMFRYLMDNAIASKDAIGLSLGVGLTAEQVAALTHDIVWLEEHEVLGERVLVPVLYLAQAEGRLAANGALIQGRDVSLISGGDLVNQGTLRASGNLNAMADNIGNSGLIEANQRLQLLATDSIRNAAGGIIAGRDVSVTALTGDIINERTVTSYAAEGRGFSQYGSLLDNAARIEATGNLSLSAGRDIQNIGGALSTAGNAELHAGNDLVIAAAQEQTGQTRQDRRHFWSSTSTIQHGSDVQVGGDLAVTAGQDIAVVASKVKADGDVLLDAGRDVTIAAAANESSSEYRYKRSGKKIDKADSNIRQQAAVIEAGGDLNVSAGRDLTLVASQLRAANDIDLDAGQDVNILSDRDENASYYFKSKKGSFGRSKSEQRESYGSTNIASVIDAGNDLTINTSKTAGGGLSIDGGRDVTVIGSQLSAGNDLLVGATGDVAILSGVEEHGSYSKKTKSGFLGMSKSGKSQLKTSATQVASELDAGNDVVIAAGNDVRLRASTTEAGNDVELRSGLIKDTGDINLVSVNDEAYSLTEQYRKKAGLSVSGGMLSVSSAKKAGQEARSSTSVGSHIAAERDASLLAERDINVIGSSVNAGRNLLLDAGRDVNVAAAKNQASSATWERERRTGIGLDSDRNGFTAFVGNDVRIEKGLDTRQTAAASGLEAGNDLDVNAGRDANLSGSDFSAGRDINVVAERDINLDAATEHAFQERQEAHQRTGLTVNVSHNFGNTVNAIKGIGQGGNLVSQVSSVLKAADAVTQFVSGPTTANHLGTTRQQTTTTDGVLGNRPTTLEAGRDINLQAGSDITAKGSQIQAERDINMSGRNITLDVARGQQTSSTEQVTSQSGINGGSTFNSARVGIGGSHGVHTEEGKQGTALAAQLQAGRDVNLEASRDLSLIATHVEAGRDIGLAAGHDIEIRAAQDDAGYEMRRRSGGGEVGVALGGQDFISVYASVDIGKGRLDRESGKQQEAYLYAGNQLSFESGRDTTVAGARLEGQDVGGKVGRDLLVSSVPNTGKVSGSELDASLTVSVGIYGSVSVSGSMGIGKTSGSTDWVENQTGIVARDRLDIRTENHTQLDGAMLASENGNLKLDTGTLGFRDIEGHDREHAWYVNAGGTYTWGSDSGSGGGQPADGNAAAKGAVVDPSQQNKDGSNNWNLSGYDYRKEREQIVRATVGEGEIVVRADEENGHDPTAGLNRDVSKAYEITKDKEERTELYVSKSSFDAVSDPVVTLDQWKNGAENYGRNSVEAFTKLGALKEHARSAAEHDRLVSALAWAPALLVDAMDAMGTPTLGIFPGVANHGGLITQLPVLVTGDLQPLRVTGTFKTDTKGKLVLEEGKPILDTESLQVQRFAGFNDEADKIFTNGIMNSMMEALANGLMQSSSGNGDVSFVLAYNPTHGLIGDLIESAFDKNLQGAIRSGTARNLNGLFQQGIDAGPDALHIYGHSQGGLLTWVAIKGLDFSNGGSPTATLSTIQLSGAPVDAKAFHYDAKDAGFEGKEQRVFQVNRPDETVFFGLLPKTDTVSDLPLLLGGNAQYSDDPVARTLGALFTVTSLFDDTKSPHSNYACVACKPLAPGSVDAQIRDIVIKPTLIDEHGNIRNLQ